jgi:Flp pilus assembly protein CpaB
MQLTTRVRRQTTAPAATTVDRRLATLPTGRAVVGGLLVAVAALGLFTAWSQANRHHTTRYLVAARDLPAGTVLSADLLATVEADVKGAPADRLFADPARLIGRVTTTPVQSGELLSASMVQAPQDAPPVYEMAVSLTTDAALAGQIRIGDHVTVVASDDHCTSVLAADVAVQRIDEQGDSLSAGKYIVNLRLANAAQLLALAQADKAGTVRLARSDTSSPAPICGVTK